VHLIPESSDEQQQQQQQQPQQQQNSVAAFESLLLHPPLWIACSPSSSTFNPDDMSCVNQDDAICSPPCVSDVNRVCVDVCV
jgi:hypothetical protein